MSEDKKIFVRRIQVALKLLELSLAIVCTGLIVDPINHKMQSNAHHISLVSVAYAGFIFVNVIVILGQLHSERMPKVMCGLFSLVGLALFLAAGSIIIDDWRHLWDGAKHMGHPKKYMNMMIASGILGIINASVFLVDLCLTIAFG